MPSFLDWVYSFETSVELKAWAETCRMSDDPIVVSRVTALENHEALCDSQDSVLVEAAEEAEEDAFSDCEDALLVQAAEEAEREELSNLGGGDAAEVEAVREEHADLGEGNDVEVETVRGHADLGEGKAAEPEPEAEEMEGGKFIFIIPKWVFIKFI